MPVACRLLLVSEQTFKQLMTSRPDIDILAVLAYQQGLSAAQALILSTMKFMHGRRGVQNSTTDTNLGAPNNPVGCLHGKSRSIMRLLVHFAFKRRLRH